MKVELSTEELTLLIKATGLICVNMIYLDKKDDQYLELNNIHNKLCETKNNSKI